MNPLLCDRPHAHAPHLWVDASDVDHDCPGRRVGTSLPLLLAERPALADVGVAARAAALVVMSA